MLQFQKSHFNNSSYKKVQKEIKIIDKRKVFTNKELDYTCIELFKSDGILDYFKIDPKIFKSDKYYLKDNDIFILQFPNDNDLSFSYGKVLSLKDNKIFHSASTDNGSSGSPVIRRSKDNNIIGLHYGVYKEKYNLATCFDSILDNIKEQNNEINCIYIPKENETEINLLHDYNLDLNELNENRKEIYLDAKFYILNMKENIEIYVNNKKISFDVKYKIKESKELKVKFKFKKLLSNTSYMFYECSSLSSIDLSSFNTTNINNMSFMFYKCCSLKSINLSSFNTTNLNDMNSMFSCCFSLKSIDLSSFNTTNVNNMSKMFFWCSSLNSINLSSFNTTYVNDMSFMFYECSSLNSIDLSRFDTTNVKNMSFMFYKCSKLNSIDLSSFNTTNVSDMSHILHGCSALKKENIKIKNKNDKILNDFEKYLI